MDIKLIRDGNMRKIAKNTKKIMDEHKKMERNRPRKHCQNTNINTKKRMENKNN